MTRATFLIQVRESGYTSAMPAVIAMVRGVNVGGHHKIKMEVLRALCTSLKFDCAQTLLQSGNVVFRSSVRSPDQISNVLETAIEKKLGFRPAVILRTIPELRSVIAECPFAKRSGLDPGKLVVSFFAADTTPSTRKALLAMDIAPEELHVRARELYIYFPNGQGRPKLSWAVVDKILNKMPLTSRNWNTVTKLLEMAESLGV
jgi:uncharacterized protein (DUF1697 family)